MSASEEDQKWFYNQETKTVEQGRQSSFEHRLGPYDSKEEAEQAMEIVAARNAAADAYDEAEEEWKD